jgi:hypothetical protein
MAHEFPRPDDRLFRDDQADWIYNAVLDYNAGKFPPYAAGYQEGAKALIQSCISHEQMQDILIYPIVFLSRQYFELRMKEIIIALRYIQGEHSDFPKHHRLDQIWSEMKKRLKTIGEDVTNEDFNNAERLILEFTCADPISMAFRYPVDKDGNKSLTMTHINIQNLGEVLERMFCLFDALSDMVANYQDLANDMFRDLYSSANYNL